MNEGHEGDWKTCAKCRKSFQTEIYVWYGTNEYNFTKLEKPPSYKPTKCIDCGSVISLANDGYASCADGYRCLDCSNLHAEKRYKQIMADREKEQMKKTKDKTPAPDNVVYLPQFTPQAKARWDSIPKPTRDAILQSVFCVNCKGSEMKLKSGKMKKDMLVLEGTCAKCGGKVVRCVEPAD